MKTKRQDKKSLIPIALNTYISFCHFLIAFYCIFLQSVNNLIKFNDILQVLIRGFMTSKHVKTVQNVQKDKKQT